MPFPIIPILVGAAAGSLLSGLVKSVTKPGELLATYHLNSQFPYLIPDQSAIIDLYNSGLIGIADFVKFMSWQACNINTEEGKSHKGSSWWRLTRLHQAKIPLEMIRLLQAQGVMTDEQAMEAFDLLGFAHHPKRKAIFGVSTPLDLATTGILINRGVMPEREWERRCKEAGHWSGTDQGYLKELLHNIPGPADLVTFAVREGWDIDSVRKFGYDEEFPPEFDAWMRKQGFGGSAAVAGEQTVTGQDLTWSRIYWRAHWQTLAPTLAYEMVRRLRPTGGRNGGPRDPSGEIFSPEDLKQVLKINDYPTPFRPKLFAIQHAPIGVRESRQLYNYGLIDKQEVSELWQDQGHNKADADLMAAEVEWADVIKMHRSPHHLNASGVIDAYKSGAISRLRAAALLLTVLEERKDVLTQARGMGDDELGTFALSFEYIKSALAGADLELDFIAVKVKLAAVRRRYLHGFMADGDLNIWLQSTGIEQERVSYYGSLWAFERRANLQVVSTERVVRFFREGLVNYGTADQVLQNLGWQTLDRRLILAEALQEIETAQLRAAARAEQNAEKQAAKQARLVAALQREKERELKRLLASSTRGDILKWLKRGLISPEEARARLIQHGMLPEDADLAVADALTPGKTPAPPKTPAGTGGAGGSGAPAGKPVLLPIATILRLYLKDLLTREQTVARLVQHGLAAEDANLEIEDARTAKPKPPEPAPTPPQA
jgi:hypothetical protein